MGRAAIMSIDRTRREVRLRPEYAEIYSEIPAALCLGSYSKVSKRRPAVAAEGPETEPL